MLIPQPSYRVFSGLPPKTHWAPAGVSRRGPRGFWLPSGGELSARRTGGPGRRAPTVADAPRRSASPSGLAGNGPGRGSHGYAGRSRCPCGFGPGPVSDMGKAPWGVCSEGLPVRVVRRRATLPHPVGCSTIAVPGLSFRVRNGTGRLSWAMAAANLGLSAGKRGFPPACGGSGTGQWTRFVAVD